MLSATLWFLAGVAITFGAIIVHGLRLLRRSGRSASDPDKETPPKGWQQTTTNTIAARDCVFEGLAPGGRPWNEVIAARPLVGLHIKAAKPDGSAVIESKPANAPRDWRSICVHCLHPIPDGETVWMHAPTGEVWHVRCRERYVKDRRTTLWEG